jgi:glycosyltransferase involved in cell wall biosynthesis
MKIAIIDTLGLCYDGDTLNKRGLGGSESAVILISKELVKLGLDVDVYNNCVDSEAKPGIYDGVKFIDHSAAHQFHEKVYDIVISSRSVNPFFAGNTYAEMCARARYRILWMHDTFCDGDQHIEGMLVSGYLNEVFTLSDWHTMYASTNDHGGQRRMQEVMKHKFWQTRNGTVRWIDEVDVSQKDKDLFVYNASATKGLIPLLKNIWPSVKHHIPTAKLTCIGGFYRFREGAEPDAQEKTVRDLMQDPEIAKLDVTFTGVIPQQEIASILSKANFMLYPADFPETFGISSLESLLYRTPIITSNFGALEETAIEEACYKINYPAVPNSLFPNVDSVSQAENFVRTTVEAYNNPYLHQQKRYACDIVKDVAGWDSVAKEWRQHFFNVFKIPLDVNSYREVSRITDKVARVFKRRNSNDEQRKRYTSYGKQKRMVVISPFYNAQDYVMHCINSVAQQDYDNYLHILIDDASTDNSYRVAQSTIENLPKEIQTKFRLIRNNENVGCIRNQFTGFSMTTDEDVIMLLDGDDWLINNNTIFHYYNDLYQQGYDFTYGSCWSLVDNIPLVAQDYPKEVIQSKTYRNHRFNWIVPYTHLRTFKADLTRSLNPSTFKTSEEEWMKAGADTPLFYELIERSKNPYAVKEIMINYNDINPLNDYKIKGEEQNRNARSAIQ